MNEQLEHLIKDRCLSEEIIKLHEIVYNPGRFCLSFPIKDEYGQYKGQLEYRPGSEPKYIYLLKQSNKPAIYNSEQLKNSFYGKPIIVTESPIDTLSLERLGFTSVSTLSARMNEAHLKILSRYTNKIILFFDSDFAGQKVATDTLKRFGEEYGIYNFIFKKSKDANDALMANLGELLKDELNRFMSNI